MDAAHAILFAKTIDISRVTADYSSAKFKEALINSALPSWCICFRPACVDKSST